MSTPALGWALTVAAFGFGPASAQVADAVWTRLPTNGRIPEAYAGGWSVYDSRRGRFFHHPGRAVVSFRGIGFIYSPWLWTVDTEANTPWSRFLVDGDLPLAISLRRSTIR